MKKKIDLQRFSKEELQKIVSECFDKTELATKLGFTYFNGKVSKKLTELVQNHQVSIDHFDASKKVKDRRKYPIIKKICPVCKSEFESQVGNKEERTTCSYSCSNIYFASIRYDSSSNNKKSESLILFHVKNGTRRNLINKNCQICCLPFQTMKQSQIYCSNSCATKADWQNEDYRIKITLGIKQRIDNGTHKGWSSRSKLEPSYAEKYIIFLLEELNLVIERELKMGRWFIDFADPIKKLALEIDGKQHNLLERKLSDEKKDKYLIDNGWKVLRIKWKKISKEFRNELIESISRFFNQGLL